MGSAAIFDFSRVSVISFFLRELFYFISFFEFYFIPLFGTFNSTQLELYFISYYTDWSFFSLLFYLSSSSSTPSFYSIFSFFFVLFFVFVFVFFFSLFVLFSLFFVLSFFSPLCFFFSIFLVLHKRFPIDGSRSTGPLLPPIHPYY